MLGARRILLSRYSVAVLSTLLTLLMRFLLVPLLGREAPLLLFIMPVMFSAWYGGLGAGLLATGSSVLVGTYFFIAPSFSFQIPDLANLTRIGIFITEGVFISWLSEALRGSQQRAERTALALQESEEQYRLLVEGVKDYAIIMLDPNGRIASWNTGAERVGGYSAPEVLGRHFSMLSPPDVVEQHQPEQELQIATTEGHYEGQGWRQRKDGSRFWADVVLTALQNNRGNLRGFVKVTRDITERKAAAEALQTSEERFRQAVLNAPLPIMLHSEAGEVVQINQVWTEITGYHLDDIPTLDAWTERAYGDRKAEMQAIISTQHPLTERKAMGEYAITTRTGETRIWDFYAAPLQPLSERKRLVIVTAIDITARKQAEEALTQEKANSDLERKRLQAVLDILPVGVFIANTDGQIIDINSAARAIWGEEAPMVETMGQYQEYKGWWSGTEHRLASHEWPLARTLQEGRTFLNEEIDIETFGGQRKTILNSTIPIRDGAGVISNAVAVNVDITRHKQAEESLRRAVQRLETLQQIDRAILQATSSEAIARSALRRLNQVIAYQQAGLLLFNFEANEAKVLAGQVDSTAAGSVMPISAFSSLESLRYRESVRYIEDLGTMLQRPPMLEYQFKQGMRSVLIVALLVEGGLIGDLYLFADKPDAFNAENRTIAQETANQLAIAIQQARLREQLQQYAAELEQRVEARTAELQEANEALQAFTYSVSHDLRSPLRAMEGLGMILLEDYGDRLDATGQDYMQRIVRAARDMDTLILDLLDYSRLSRTDIPLQVLNLNTVVTDVLTPLRDAIAARQAQVMVESPLPEVMAHYTILSQTLTNLLTNALKYTQRDRQPQVRLWAEERLDETGAWVRLWIEDNGIGIEPQFQEQIFQIFERLHSAEIYPGTGIGLAIVRKGVERMGGRVGVESQVGEGSRFWIELRKPPA